MLDFGVSKLTVADAATTGDITLSGTSSARPSTWRPSRPVGQGRRSPLDIYSLGVVLYEMLAGRPPFVGEHFSGLMLDIMQRDPPPLVGFRTDVPRRLASVIHRALERDLEKRYLDMQGFIVALESVGRDELKLAMETPPEGLVTKLALPRLTPAIQPAPLSPLRDRRLLTAVSAIAVGAAVRRPLLVVSGPAGGGCGATVGCHPGGGGGGAAGASPRDSGASRRRAEAAKPPAAGVLVKHPAAPIEPAPLAAATAPEPSSLSKRSSRKRDGRTGGGDREQAKDEAAAAAAALRRCLSV